MTNGTNHHNPNEIDQFVLEHRQEADSMNTATEPEQLYRSTADWVRRDGDRKPLPGIYEGVSFADYCEWDAVNNSSLGPALRSPAHYKHARENPREDTAAFRLGRLLHEGRLEPAAVLDRYVVMPDLTKEIDAKRPKATTEYKDRVAKFHDENADREVVEQSQFDEVKGMLDAMWTNQLAREWLHSPGPAELSIVWVDPITGLTCKARFDKMPRHDLIVDVKTTNGRKEFELVICDYDYDRQAAFYSDGWRVLTGTDASFGFVSVESAGPHGCRAAPLSPRGIAAGRVRYRKAMEVIKAGRESGTWPGYENPDQFELPEWRTNQEPVIYRNGKVIEL